MPKQVITFRNAITGDRREVQVAKGQSVRDAVIAAGMIAPGNMFSVRDRTGTVVDNDEAIEHASEVLQVGPPGNVQGGGGDIHVSATDMIILSASLIPLLAAFFTELGKKLGRSAADQISHIRLRQNSNDPAIVEVQVHSDRTVTTIEVTENLSGDARFALFQLDFNNPAIRGKRLKWDDKKTRWVPCD